MRWIHRLHFSNFVARRTRGTIEFRVVSPLMDPEHKSPSSPRLLLQLTITAVVGVVIVAGFLLAPRDSSPGISTSDGAEQTRHTSATPANADVPELTQPVNDFANVMGSGRYDIEVNIGALFSETADVIVVATVQNIAPFSDIRDYSIEMFKNHGRGIGASGKDNGILVLLAVDNKRVRITTGLGMETIISDAAATQITQRMADYFQRGEIDAGLLAGVEDLARRIRTARTPGPKNSS